MIGLVVIAHAPFATALMECARHVYGCEPERCAVLDVMADVDPAGQLELARQAVVDVDHGHGVLVLVDMFGATPGNIAAQLTQAGRTEVVAGVNLPMLLRVLCYRATTAIADLPEKALGGGASGIMKIASVSPQNQRPFPHDPNQNSRRATTGDSNDGAGNDGHTRLQDQQ